MAIKNTYPTKEHRIFKRTFLQHTEVTIGFTPALSDVDFRNRMIPFLKSVFNLDLTGKADAEANHAEIKSENEQKQFIFDLDQARFIIGPKSYKTFAETAIPMIGILMRFVSEVARLDAVNQFSIIKFNEWPIKVNDAYSNFTDMIRYTFKEKYVSDMLSYKFDENPQPVKLSKTSKTDFEDNLRLETVLSAEVVSKEMANMELAFNVTAKNIGINDMLSDAITMNDILYQEFIGAISENITNLMSREKLS